MYRIRFRFRYMQWRVVKYRGPKTVQQPIRQNLIVTYAILMGFTTALLSLFQPIPFASAQQLIGPVSQETSGTGTQGRPIENIAPTIPYLMKSLEKKEAQTATRKPHRLIRKPQHAPIASVESAPSGSAPLSSVPIPSQSLPSDNTTSQSKEPTSLSSSVGTAVPLATISVAPSSATATGSIAVGIAPTGTIPLAAAGVGKSSASGSGYTGGRTMSRLAAEMPGLTQLLSPTSVPVVSVNPAIGASPTSMSSLTVTPTNLSFTATQGAANPANQSVTVSSSGTWTVSKNATWLTITPTSGANAGAITASVNSATATVGTNSATLTVTGGGITRTVTVTLTLNAPSTSSAILTWTPNTDPDLASYRVYQSTAQGVYGATIATVPAGTASYTATGLQVGTTYYFRITAVDSASNESQPSNEVNKSIF